MDKRKIMLLGLNAIVGPASAEPRYIDIRRGGARWSLQIEGLWGRRAEVFLDEDYGVTRANCIFTH